MRLRGRGVPSALGRRVEAMLATISSNDTLRGGNLFSRLWFRAIMYIVVFQRD